MATLHKTRDAAEQLLSNMICIGGDRDAHFFMVESFMMPRLYYPLLVLRLMTFFMTGFDFFTCFLLHPYGEDRLEAG